jgi:hypothetical protein
MQLKISVTYKDMYNNTIQVHSGNAHIGNIQCCSYEAPYGQDHYYCVVLFRFTNNDHCYEQRFKDIESEIGRAHV